MRDHHDHARPCGLLAFAVALCLSAGQAGQCHALDRGHSVGQEAKQGAKRAATVQRRLGAMGTWLDVVVTARSRARALELSEVAVRELATTEARLSTWRSDTELARLHQQPQPVRALSPALATELDAALRCAAATEGAFDPTVGPLVEAWGLRGAGRVPNPAELAAARSRVGYQRVRVHAGALHQERLDIQWEEGGFGKGAGLDAALAAWRQLGVREGSVDLGGQIAWLGKTREVAVAHPHHRQQPAVYLTLAAGSVATSGNSEHGRQVAGRPVGHLLDPRTAEPAPDFGSVTVWSPSALVADCLSTALFVMGPQRALDFVEANRDTHGPLGLGPVEVLVLQVREGQLSVRHSAGLAGRVRIATEPP
jgi:thiamine biosynthesis lipoprotein